MMEVGFHDVSRPWAEFEETPILRGPISNWKPRIQLKSPFSICIPTTEVCGVAGGVGVRDVH